MNYVEHRRTEIYNFFHASLTCRNYFHDPVCKDDFVAYYNSMRLLQDSTESLSCHRSCGFSKNPYLAYLEFWGLMQATTIQQDAIAELYQVVLGRPLEVRKMNLGAWLQVRALRNICAGHPAKKTLPKSEPVSRTFMSRRFGNYASITYEKWERGIGVSYPTVPLGQLLDDYAKEAETQLSTVLNEMKTRWPQET
jgi:hypothetical protein